MRDAAGLARRSAYVTFDRGVLDEKVFRLLAEHRLIRQDGTGEWRFRAGVVEALDSLSQQQPAERLRVEHTDQLQPQRRGAVVIGINKTGGGLFPLESAVAGARVFGDWLISEGFEVATITDDMGPVVPEQIIRSIAVFVTSGNCRQLIIYFSGHAFWKNDSELWLLTNAPGDPNAAINSAETAELAQTCGIPNVILISDVCRSIPNTPQHMRVRGTLVFPNEDFEPRGKVDKFMASAAGRQVFAISVGDDGRKENVFTHCFLQAFRAPDRDMILNVTEGGQVIQVIPNRRLAKYLQREVAVLPTWYHRLVPRLGLLGFGPPCMLRSSDKSSAKWRSRAGTSSPASSSLT